MIDEKAAARVVVGWTLDAIAKAVAAERARCAAVCREVAARPPVDGIVEATALECAEAIERGAVGT